MDNVTALKNLYASLGGNPEDVADVSQISDMIEAVSTVAASAVAPKVRETSIYNINPAAADVNATLKGNATVEDLQADFLAGKFINLVVTIKNNGGEYFTHLVMAYNTEPGGAPYMEFLGINHQANTIDKWSISTTGSGPHKTLHLDYRITIPTE